jgi:hypothetical protein
MIDGQNQSSPYDAWSILADDQKEDAVRLLKIWKARKYFQIRGTSYHTMVGRNMFCEDAIAKELGAEKFPDNSYSKQEFDFQSNGIKISFAHHSGGSRLPWTLANAVSRQQVLAMLDDVVESMALQKQFKPTDLVVRGTLASMRMDRDGIRTFRDRSLLEVA